MPVLRAEAVHCDLAYWVQVTPRRKGPQKRSESKVVSRRCVGQTQAPTFRWHPTRDAGCGSGRAP